MYQDPLGPGVLPAFQEGADALPVEGRGRFGLDPAQVEQGGHHVHVGRQRRHVAATLQPTGGPAEEERYPVSSVVRRALHAAHAGVEAPRRVPLPVEVDPAAGPVVGHEDEDGVALEAPVGEGLPQGAEVFVDVGDHAVELRPLLGHQASVGRAVARLHVVGAMRSVGRDGAEEGVVPVALEEAQRLAEPDVGAVALEVPGFPVDGVGVVEVVVSPVVGGLADASAAVGDHLVEAAVLRPVGRAVAQVPLAEQAGPVAAGPKGVGERQFVLVEQGAPADRVPHAGAVGVVAGVEPRPGGGAGGADVEVGEAHTIGVQGVDAGRLQDRVAVAAEVAVALVVGDDEDHVGSGGSALRIAPSHASTR